MKSPIYYLKWFFVVKPKLSKELAEAKEDIIKEILRKL